MRQRFVRRRIFDFLVPGRLRESEYPTQVTSAAIHPLHALSTSVVDRIWRPRYAAKRILANAFAALCSLQCLVADVGVGLNYGPLGPFPPALKANENCDLLRSEPPVAIVNLAVQAVTLGFAGPTAIADPPYDSNGTWGAAAQFFPVTSLMIAFAFDALD